MGFNSGFKGLTPHGPFLDCATIAFSETHINHLKR